MSQELTFELGKCPICENPVNVTVAYDLTKNGNIVNDRISDRYADFREGE